MTKIKAIHYTDATLCKLKNRRVQVRKLNEQDIAIEFLILCDKEEAHKPSSIHKVVKDKIKLTGIKISLEAAIALQYALGQQLEKMVPNPSPAGV